MKSLSVSLNVLKGLKRFSNFEPNYLAIPANKELDMGFSVIFKEEGTWKLLDEIIRNREVLLIEGGKHSDSCYGLELTPDSIRVIPPDELKNKYYADDDVICKDFSRFLKLRPSTAAK
jgi:hypothetical protein